MLTLGLGELLNEANYLIDINLDDNELLGPHLDSIFDGARMVQRLSINKCNLKECKAVARLLRSTNSALAKLSLSTNAINDDDGAMLAEALSENTVLTHLDLSINNLKDKTGFALASALTVNRSLQVRND